MNSTVRRLKLIIGTFAVTIALTLAVGPMTQPGFLTQNASAEINTNDFSSQAYFQNFCKSLGGTFEQGKYYTSCVLPDGHIYLCDETAKNCTFYVKRPLVANVSNVNGTVTTTGTGSGGTTTTTGTSRTTNSAVLNTENR